MKILVLSRDEIFGNAIAIELAEAGYAARYSEKFENGYHLYVVDADSIDAQKIKGLCVTFSTKEGQGDLERPFLTERLIDAVEGYAQSEDEKKNRRYQHISLTEKERKLLDLLLDNRGRVVSTEEIALKVWGREEISSNIVNVYIRYLREKLEGDNGKRIIITVRGKGYKIE